MGKVQKLWITNWCAHRDYLRRPNGGKLLLRHAGSFRMLK